MDWSLKFINPANRNKIKRSALKIINFLRRLFSLLFFDLFEVVLKWRGIPNFISNYLQYQKIKTDANFNISLKNIYPILTDRYHKAGTDSGHYFFMDIWAAQQIYDSKVKYHVDAASRIDGFVAHLLPFCKVDYVDLREMKSSLQNLIYIKGSILELPYSDNSVNSMSCLHVIEHIGLGRYGDKVEPLGHIKAMKELQRALSKNGVLFVGVPVGSERLCFDAHRIFDPSTIVNGFSGLKLEEFSLIDDAADKIIYNATFDMARNCRYGCGLFKFVKN